jgi:hypothetical protein
MFSSRRLCAQHRAQKCHSIRPEGVCDATNLLPKFATKNIKSKRPARPAQESQKYNSKNIVSHTPVLGTLLEKIQKGPQEIKLHQSASELTLNRKNGFENFTFAYSRVRTKKIYGFVQIIVKRSSESSLVDTRHTTRHHRPVPRGPLPGSDAYPRCRAVRSGTHGLLDAPVPTRPHHQVLSRIPHQQ